MMDVENLLKEIKELGLYDHKFYVNVWYEYRDEYRDRIETFKVLGYEFDYNKKVRIIFRSINGEMEKIDQEELYPYSFPSGCSYYNNSTEIPDKVAEIRIKEQIKDIL